MTGRASILGFEMVADRSVPPGLVAVVNMNRGYVGSTSVQWFRFPTGGGAVESLTLAQVGEALTEQIAKRFDRVKNRKSKGKRK